MSPFPPPTGRGEGSLHTVAFTATAAYVVYVHRRRDDRFEYRAPLNRVERSPPSRECGRERIANCFLNSLYSLRFRSECELIDLISRSANCEVNSDERPIFLNSLRSFRADVPSRGCSRLVIYGFSQLSPIDLVFLSSLSSFFSRRLSFLLCDPCDTYSRGSYMR